MVEAVRFHCFTGLQSRVGGVSADEGGEGVMWEEQFISGRTVRDEQKDCQEAAKPS